MKEKIKDHLMMVDKYASTLDSDIERHADEIMELINQEVEKRIAERMPSDEEIDKEAYNYSAFMVEDGNVGFDQKEYAIFMDGAEWLRSRLTCSEKPNNSQKTEGGNQ